MGKLKVLLVDDEVAVLEVISKRIKSWGYDLVTALSGKQAIDLLKSEASDVIILDYIMAGMDGIATLTEIRKINKEIPVIMFTAYPDDRSMKSAQELNVSAYIPKSSMLTDPVSNLKTTLAFIEQKLGKNTDGRKKIK